MRVLLTTLNAKYIHLNLAIRLLYSLNKHRQGLEWKEFTIKEDKNAIAEFCKDFEIVAFSCYIWNISQTLEVCKLIKAKNPNTKILLGGPEVSYEWEEVIALAHVDYIIIGEGEIPFAAFLDNYPNLDAVYDLVRKVDGDIHYMPKNEIFPLINYSQINPYIYDKPEELANKVCYIETSRGCPYKCEFCLASLDNKVRYLPTDDIKANLLYLMQHGKTIKFLDRTFNIKRDFTIDIFKFILENHKPENVFQFEITADILHKDIIQFIDDNVPKGLFRFEIGIQTVNQKANLEVSRKQNFEKTSEIVNSLKHKVEMHLDLIVGLALDYMDDIKYSFEAVFKLYPPELQLGFLKFLKGTPVRDKSNQHGFVFDKNPPYQIIESNYLSKEELANIVKLEHALEIYWNKKRAPYTLKYITENYSIFDFLMGLGQYFGTQKDYHRYSLEDVYKIAFEYIVNNHSDPILKELIAIDYYLTSYVKPKNFLINEVEKTDTKAILESFETNPKCRYAVLPLSFNFTLFAENAIIEKGDYQLIIQYSGTEKPILISSFSKKLMKEKIM
jgi:anaerobic magnesium-protoporphyrin IX monomethyl ester cyclase